MAEETISLREVAERLGVHYMTAYRYVRLGQLPATKSGGEWCIRPSDLAALQASPRPQRRRGAHWDNRLYERLRECDESGAWRVIEAALTSSHEPSDVYVDVVAPAMRRIGDEWESGELGVEIEHQASAIALRLVGRLGAIMRPRGRRKGTVMLGSPQGERHSLPLAMVSDILRAAGYEVVDLGPDVPDESFERAVIDTKGTLLAVGIGVATTDATGAASRLVERLRRSLPEQAAILVGGAAIDSAESVGADFHAVNGLDAVEFLESLRAR